MPFDNSRRFKLLALSAIAAACAMNQIEGKAKTPSDRSLEQLRRHLSATAGGHRVEPSSGMRSCC